nr:MAG TPA: hypothetical protein [Caudoviricetes sp.]
MAFTDCRVHCRAMLHSVSLIATHIGKPHKGKGTSSMACPLFLCPVYARQGRVYNIDQTKKAAEARPFRGILIHGDCTAWISVPFFRAHFNAFNKPLHGPFYTFAAWSTFVKCMKLFADQCMKAFTVVSTDFSMHEVVYHCTGPFTSACRIQCTRSFTLIFKNQCTRSFTTFSRFRRPFAIGRIEGKRG